MAFLILAEIPELTREQYETVVKMVNETGSTRRGAVARRRATDALTP